MAELRALLGAHLNERWRRTGATLVAEQITEEAVDGSAPSTTVTVTLSGIVADSHPAGHRTVHSRGTGATLTSAAAAALYAWSFGEVQPVFAVPESTCPHGARDASERADVTDLIKGLNADTNVEVGLRRRTRDLTLFTSDGRGASCRSVAWRLVVRSAVPGVAPIDLLFVDTTALVVNALQLEMEMMACAMGLADPSPPGAVLIAPEAVRDLLGSALDHTYARGLSGASGLRLADAAPEPPSASCFDATGRRPTVDVPRTVADEVAVDGAASIFLPGMDVPNRRGAVMVPTSTGTQWRRPVDACVLVGCGSLAPAGLMSGPNLVVAPIWASVRDGRVRHQWSSAPFLMNLPHVLDDISGWSADGSWRSGQVQTPGAWWELSEPALRPAGTSS